MAQQNKKISEVVSPECDGCSHDCEKVSQIKKAFHNLIQLSGVPMGVVASELGISISQLSMLLSTHEEYRRPSPSQMRSIIRLVKSRPIQLLKALDDVESLTEEFAFRELGAR